MQRRQCNLELYSDFSLSALAGSSANVCNKTSSRPAATVTATSGAPRDANAVHVGLKGVPSSRATTAVQEASWGGGSDTEQGSSGDASAGDERSTQEAADKTDSLERSAEVHVYSELTAITDKMKDQFQALVVEESRIQQLVGDITVREEEADQKEEEMKGREVAMKQRETDVNEREEELRRKEEEMNQREVEVSKREEKVKRKETKIQCKEEGLDHQEEVLSSREADIARREADISSREEVLVGREERVIEMERLVCEAHRSLVQCMEQEVQMRVNVVEEGQREEMERLGMCVKEKNRELKRLRVCYETVKKANDNLKGELEEKNSKLQSQLSVSHGRLVSLQKKNEQLTDSQQTQLQYREQQRRMLVEVDALKLQLSRPKLDQASLVDTTVCHEVIGSLMDWLCRVHLSQPLSPAQETAVQQTSSKILPTTATLVVSIPSLPAPVRLDLQQPVLAFVYWCLAHLAKSKKQKSALASTLRRIGETIYNPVVSEGRSEGSVGVFLNSCDAHIRVISCLVIFHTVTQVDCLAKVFEKLQHELKEGHKAKELFLMYCGVDCILPFMKASCRVLCTHTVNTYLLLSVESVLLSQFLSALSSEGWFSACAALLRETPDTATLEKMSIILQRLSKVSGIRGLFESQRVLVAVQQLLRQRQTLPDSSFICLNLQSTLTNLTYNDI